MILIILAGGSLTGTTLSMWSKISGLVGFGSGRRPFVFFSDAELDFQCLDSFFEGSDLGLRMGKLLLDDGHYGCCIAPPGIASKNPHQDGANPSNNQIERIPLVSTP